MNFVKLLEEKNSHFDSVAPVCGAFLGDSVTHGVFEIYKGHNVQIDVKYDFTSVYHSVLGKMLAGIYPAAPLNIINAGVSGGNAPQGFKRIDRDVLAYSPSLVVVCFGLNDVHNGLDKINAYANALRGILGRLKEHKLETIFLTPNMMNTYVSPQLSEKLFIEIAKKSAELQNDGTMDAYMDCAREICAEEKVPVCDCYKKWKMLNKAGVDTTALLCNHINHPNREMHNLFASSLFDMLMFGKIVGTIT